MKRKKPVCFTVLVCIFNLITALSVFFSYADAHGMLSDAFMTEHTIANTFVMVVHVLAMIYLFCPFALILLSGTVTAMVKERKTASWRSIKGGALLAVILLFAVTLLLKYVLILSIAAVILFPDSFHI